MKLIEAMKRLKVVEKRIACNAEDVQKYASILSNEKPAFDTEDAQKKEIKSLIQSSNDLVGEYLDLKKKIEKTNIGVEVEINGKKYTISDLLVIKRKLARLVLMNYEALNTNAAENKLRHRMTDADIKPVQMYDEKFKNEKLREWQDLYDNIDSRLEVVNATTDLIE